MDEIIPGKCKFNVIKSQALIVVLHVFDYEILVSIDLSKQGKVWKLYRVIEGAIDSIDNTLGHNF